MTPDERRLHDLADRHGPRVLAYLGRRVDPREDAADVYQAVLTTTWRKIHAVPSDHDVALGWLVAVARRELANHRRGQARRMAATERLRDALATGEHTAYEKGPQDPAVDALRAALDQLDETDRELVTMTYWDDLTSEQAAGALGISPAAARKRLQRARQRLAGRVTSATEGDTEPVRHASQGRRRALTSQ